MSTMSNRWQQAWEQAEQRLRVWQQSWVPPHVRESPMRVGQLDAELLDEELVQLLQEPILKALGTLSSVYRNKIGPELALFVRLVLYKFSLWDKGTTYGAKLQDLRYITSTSSRDSGKLAPSGLLIRKLALHASATVLVPYLHTRFRNHALSHAWPDTPSTDARRKLWDFSSKLENVYSAAALASFIIFLWNGRYRTLADRICSLKLVPIRRFTNRQVSYEFMNRQMVWHAFTEFLLLTLPLLNSRAMRRSYNQARNTIRGFNWRTILPGPLAPSQQNSGEKKPIKKGRFAHLPSSQCAICAEKASPGILPLPGVASESYAYLNTSFTPLTGIAEDERNEDGYELTAPPSYPITTPYTTSCGHIYCYICIAEQLVRAVDDGYEGWECLRCAEIVRSCDRVEAEGESESDMGESWTNDVEDDLGSFSSD